MPVPLARSCSTATVFVVLCSAQFQDNPRNSVACTGLRAGAQQPFQHWCCSSRPVRSTLHSAAAGCQRECHRGRQLAPADSGARGKLHVLTSLCILLENHLPCPYSCSISSCVSVSKPTPVALGASRGTTRCNTSCTNSTGNTNHVMM